MVSRLPSTCCMRGSMHNGEPTGTEETIHGLSTYVALPEDGNYVGTIVIIGDVFGWDFLNLRLLADSYAQRARVRALMPDFQFGDSFSKDSLDAAFPLRGHEPPLWKRVVSFVAAIPSFLLWFWTHRQGVTMPIVNKFFKALREEQDAVGGKIASVGFCWGGRYALLMNPYVDAIYAAHPSFVQIPSEIEAITKPVTLACGEKDIVLPLRDVEKIKGVLKKKDSLESEVIVYEGMEHSFAVRGNPEIEAAKKGLEGSETQAVEWFLKYLK